VSKPVLFLLGPSASGKTELSLLLARRLNCEIVSADSMLVYRGMDIGTAKPGRAQQKKVRHHLIDIVPPRKNFSVYEHRKYALEKIQDILNRGKIPLIVGASGLYVEALWKGLSDHPGKNSKLRQKLIRHAREEGIAALYAKLEAKDPARAGQIHPHDEKRVVRALEIAASGKNTSAWHQKRESLEDLGYSVFAVALERDRADLYGRIDHRVEQMFKRGLLREVERLRKTGFSKTARQALGYREILKFYPLTQTLSPKGRGKGEGQDIIRLIQKHTRQFAKRQLTWLRREKEIRWIPWPRGESAESVCDKIIKEFKRKKVS